MRKRTLTRLPRSDRPRERLIEKGVDALADRELIAILLGSGIRGRSSLALAEEILVRYESIRSFADRDPARLLAIDGIGPGRRPRFSPE